jgi:hypothetical protein
MTLETGIFLSQVIWLWRVRHIRHEAKKLGMTYDEYIEAHPSKKLLRNASLETIPDVEAAHAEEPSLPEKCHHRIQENASADQPTDANTNDAQLPVKTLAVPQKAVNLSK